ncbi:nickel-dependent hydrogenase large subunit [Candidatus Caldarchaeum subterraneum]|uniref:Nickel-dependent hydrogenase large subunit n=1 Tax=Caldiarchaeum subterraneum TaxID=311458 RepID=E6N716_CALS0|nr:nickel-dependent hydrogenase large subunit [Candidatus Caldarchaeum subterraneum]BAJ48092.1 nickel-dependent hydrogenase large subunit [Candidatus Caldarchaeum subterraneum]BAJ50875.1 nickel-dependent hydrogenase large subunit [Candidatus Caldarchaeum subterraneum]
MSKEYRVDYLARVEGEGALYVKVRGDEVVDVKFKIFEPPRLFEAFLIGRMYYDAPDITARICGICPVAYQMSSIHAMENLFGVVVEPAVRELRRLLYCGEWIESHMLHAFLLHAPDFLGYDDALKMAKRHPDVVKKALKAKKIGNDVVARLGGREIHPVSACVGGFYRVPSKRELAELRPSLIEGLKITEELLEWVAGLEFPEFEQDYEFVALRHPDEYPMNEGRIMSNKGLDITVDQYENHFAEEQVPHSNALHSYIIGRGAYMVGPLSRINLNIDKLHDLTKTALERIGFKPPCRNPFKSIIARVAETLYAFEEALRIVDTYSEPRVARVELSVRAGRGCGCTEAPRGILYHRYDVDEHGRILSAKIVPPTAQNQKSIEEDLRKLAPKIIKLPRSQAVWRFEQAIRNYDPCISCATHFLRLEVEQE